MSLPPEIIQVKRLKRKANDDDDQDVPVNYLRIDNTDKKRYRSDAYVYQRTTRDAVETENKTVPRPPQDIVPTIHPSKPTDGKISPRKTIRPQNSKSDTSAQVEESKRKDETKKGPTSPEARSSLKASSASEPRRFHFSRPMIKPSSLLTTALTTGKRSRLNTPMTTVFVERGHKRTRTEDVHMKDADSLLGESDVNKPRKFKLPGSDRKGPRAQKAAEPVVKKSVPESMAKHWAGDDMDEITRSMNDFALQIIGANLAEIEERDKKDAAAAARKEAASAASPQRFKPKPPAKRYAERHPEPVAAQQQTARTADPEGYETASEDEYVVETYVRVPASSLLGKDMAPGKVGLLVFDNEPDADYFYGEEGDSDDEWPEDDEDENAENYYTADYPDDEVDSDDEYDRGAYDYRTGNASDLEEFDERDDDEYALDHDNDGKAAMPFSARLGAMPPSAFHGR